MPRKRTEEDYRRANEKMIRRVKEHNEQTGRRQSEAEVRKDVHRVAERVSRDRQESGADAAKADSVPVYGPTKVIKARMNIVNGGKDKPKRWI